MLRVIGLVGLIVAAGAAAGAGVSGVSTEVVFETPRAKIVLNEDATWAAIVEVASGRECLALDTALPVATVRLGGTTYMASSLGRLGGRAGAGFRGDRHASARPRSSSPSPARGVTASDWRRATRSSHTRRAATSPEVRSGSRPHRADRGRAPRAHHPGAPDMYL